MRDSRTRDIKVGGTWWGIQVGGVRASRGRRLTVPAVFCIDWVASAVKPVDKPEHLQGLSSLALKKTPTDTGYSANPREGALAARGAAAAFSQHTRLYELCWESPLTFGVSWGRAGPSPPPGLSPVLDADSRWRHVPRPGRERAETGVAAPAGHWGEEKVS